MDRITRCLSTFIEEQRAFNQHIEERLSKSLQSNSNDQFQQQIVTQGLLVNLNTAYREIAVLQAEVNALHSENTRLTSSISFEQHYHPTSPEKVDPIINRYPRPPPRTHFKNDVLEERSLPKNYTSPDQPLISNTATINDHEDMALPRPTPTCTQYGCDLENQTTHNSNRRTSTHSNHRNDGAEQFDDLSYMLSAISHPYKNIVVCISNRT